MQACDLVSDTFNWASDVDPKARDRKHIRHIIERPMNAA